MKQNLIISIFVITISFLTRLVFIRSNVFFFDGDEAIVGLMGLEILDGKFPLYFYGQNYGLAFFEALLVSIGILFFKTSMLAMKIPMLILWMGSTVLIALSFLKILGKKEFLTILFISIFIFSPTWLVWSLKARGGYLTSFFFSSLIIYLLIYNNSTKIKTLTWLLIGVFLTIIFEAQPLWIPGILPIIAYSLFTQKSEHLGFLKRVVSVITGTGISYAILFYLKWDLYVAWSNPKLNLLSRLAHIKFLPKTLINSLGGNYFLSSTYEPANETFSILFLIFFLLFAGVVIYRFIKYRKVGLSLIFFFSSVLSLSGFFIKSEPRYLLPFFGFALFLMVLVYSETKKNNLRYFIIVISAIIIVSGIQHLPNFTKYSFVNMSITKVDEKIMNDTKLMKDLIKLLEIKGVKYVYSTNEFLQYQLNYMTQHKILTISRKDRCRTPQNIRKVMQAYKKHSDKFAIIGYNFHYKYSGKLPTLGNKIFYILHPDKSLLNQVGFFLKKEKPTYNKKH